MCKSKTVPFYLDEDFLWCIWVYINGLQTTLFLWINFILISIFSPFSLWAGMEMDKYEELIKRFLEFVMIFEWLFDGIRPQWSRTKLLSVRLQRTKTMIYSFFSLHASVPFLSNSLYVSIYHYEPNVSFILFRFHSLELGSKHGILESYSKMKYFQSIYNTHKHHYLYSLSWTSILKPSS